MSEMTRFGFGEAEFDRLAQLMADCILRNKDIRQEVIALRSEHMNMQYCFTDAEFEKALGKLSALIEK